MKAGVRPGVRSTEHDAAYRRLLNLVHRLDLASRRSADLALTGELGIGRSTFLILDLLAAHAAAPLTQQGIAGELGLTRAAVSQKVIEAGRAGLLHVQPSATSGRENAVTLTPTGRQLVKAGRRLRSAAARRALADLDVEQIDTTLSVLAHLERTLSTPDGVFAGDSHRRRGR